MEKPEQPKPHESGHINGNVIIHSALLKTNNNINEGVEADCLHGKTYKDLLPWNTEAGITVQFIQEIVDKLKSHILENLNRNSKVIKFKSPDELIKEIDCELNNEGSSLGDLLEVTCKALEHSVKTGHPRFFNQLFAGIDITGLMGQWVATTCNTSMYTFEMAPVFLLMEEAILTKMKETVGFTEGDGLFFPGGSISNMQAMNIARYSAFPKIKKEGLYGISKLTAFMSEEAHYSTVKAAALLGIGTNNVKTVRTERGKMVPEDLRSKIEESISKGETPFYVCATSGTTVTGAYDSLPEIADICAAYSLWLHTDAAWGGSVMYSRKHRHLARGIERADSVTWNPHKLMSVPLQCSILLVKKKGLLSECNKTEAQYLFQKDKKLYDVSLDTGDKTFQCGRLNDIFKFWLMWKAKRSLSRTVSNRTEFTHSGKGTNGFEEHVDRAFEMSRYLAALIKERDNFELLFEPECTNVCFRYIPPSIAKMADGPEKELKLHQVPPEIKKRMTLNGTMMIGYQPLKDLGNFFRMVVVSAAVTRGDMEFVVDEIHRLGKDL